jgi:hypothetical protein
MRSVDDLMPGCRCLQKVPPASDNATMSNHRTIIKHVLQCEGPLRETGTPDGDYIAVECTVCEQELGPFPSLAVPAVNSIIGADIRRAALDGVAGRIGDEIHAFEEPPVPAGKELAQRRLELRKWMVAFTRTADKSNDIPKDLHDQAS